MNAITEICQNLRLGSPQQHQSLSVFPLFANANMASSMNYMLLDAALATEAFKITEISESGTVPLLAAQNDLDQPVFLLDGDELVGAKQNRVLNLSMMLAPKSLTQIPVSCVEAGRWNRRSAKFASSGRTQPDAVGLGIFGEEAGGSVGSGHGVGRYFPEDAAHGQ